LREANVIGAATGGQVQSNEVLQLLPTNKNKKIYTRRFTAVAKKII